MKTRITFGIVAAAALLLTGFDPSDANAQNRPGFNARPNPSVQVFPQMMPPSIQQTINNMYFNEWSKRAALNSMLQPRIYVQPVPVYPAYPWYTYGYNPYIINPYIR